jgi:hypothetical protein
MSPGHGLAEGRPRFAVVENGGLTNGEAGIEDE